MWSFSTEYHRASVALQLSVFSSLFILGWFIYSSISRGDRFFAHMGAGAEDGTNNPVAKRLLSPHVVWSMLGIANVHPRYVFGRCILAVSA